MRLKTIFFPNFILSSPYSDCTWYITTGNYRHTIVEVELIEWELEPGCWDSVYVNGKINYLLKPRFHVPSPSPSPSPPNFIIVPIVTEHLMDTEGLEPIPSVSVNLTVMVTETEMARVNGPLD